MLQSDRQIGSRCVRLCAALLGFCLLAGCFVTAFYGCSSVQKQYYVAVVTKSTKSKFWKSVQAGVVAASSEYNLKYTFEGPENEEDYASQNALLYHAIDKHADAIVLSAVDYEKSVPAVEKAANNGVPVIVIDSDVHSDKVAIRITTDNVKAGEMAAKQVLTLQLAQIVAGIVNFDVNTANGQQREQGFRAMMATDKRATVLQTVNVPSDTAAATAGTKALLKDHPEINVLVTFNEWTSLGVGYAIEELGLQEKVNVVAFDNNPTSVSMLEKGAVDALVVQNPFAIGYLGVENAYHLILKEKPDKPVINTQTMVVTKDNMYDENTQKILFPFAS